MSKTCANCVYWDDSTANVAEGGTDALGMCRAAAPSVAASEYLWPLCKPTDWCGDWAASWPTGGGGGGGGGSTVITDHYPQLWVDTIASNTGSNVELDATVHIGGMLNAERIFASFIDPGQAGNVTLESNVVFTGTLVPSSGPIPVLGGSAAQLIDSLIAALTTVGLVVKQ